MKKQIIYTILILLLSSTAVAWDGVVSGTVSKIHVAHGANYAFRVYLDGSPEMCGNGHNWAYINEADSNYQVFVSTLLSAKAMSSDITIYSNRQNGDPSGYCKIGYVIFN
ncbi:MAG: hypothetical protein KZQ93_04980 [Candidatus Thiodiazotropha sp. (ex Monitilora ramsayi)]|nr:hypothetical protein [Candidatus Thiodiazotropha sp. (ex Monitilora ramsayi)]